MTFAPIFRTYTGDAYREFIAKTIKEKGTLPVITNGVFDLLHPGHLVVLEKAIMTGQCGKYAVIVALNSDESVQAIKGKRRPFMEFEGRAKMLAAIRGIDAVVGFDERTPEMLLGEFPYTVLVKGGEYQNKGELPEYKLVERVVFSLQHPHWSTTGLVSAIADRLTPADSL